MRDSCSLVPVVLSRRPNKVAMAAAQDMERSWRVYSCSTLNILGYVTLLSHMIALI